jgi:transposase
VAVPMSSSMVGTGVSTRASRRRFTVEYKTWVVQEAERCRAAGEIGGLLRREGLFSSQLTQWRTLYRDGARKALSRKRGPRSTKKVEKLEVERLQKENAKLRQKLEQAETIIALQKKVAELLGRPIPEGSGEDE